MKDIENIIRDKVEANGSNPKVLSDKEIRKRFLTFFNIDTENLGEMSQCLRIQKELVSGAKRGTQRWNIFISKLPKCELIDYAFNDVINVSVLVDTQ